MKKRLTILLSGLLMGCAASTPQQAREMGAERSYTFQVDADYQTAYRRIVDVARSCYQGNMITANMMVNTDLFPDTRSGAISVGLYGAMGPSLYQVIDVRGIDAEHTEVVAIFPMGPVEKMGAKVRAWASGSGAEC